MQSIGYDLSKWVKKGLLRFHAQRPTLYGLELHLATMHKHVVEFNPVGLVMDPITNLASIGSSSDIKAMLTRAIDFLKKQGITALFTSLTADAGNQEQTEVGVSSLMDTWLLVRMLDTNGERNRLLYILKSRGMNHSNQMREFRLSDTGIKLLDVYVGSGMVLTGSSRLVQEERDSAQALEEHRALERRERELLQESASLQAQAQAIAARLEYVGVELRTTRQRNSERHDASIKAREELAIARKAD
jgi:circadian clock protein KaiC